MHIFILVCYFLILFYVTDEPAPQGSANVNEVTSGTDSESEVYTHVAIHACVSSNTYMMCALVKLVYYV